MFDKTSYIAKFQKETVGDFEPVSSQDIRVVIEQMAINEENKKHQGMSK